MANASAHARAATLHRGLVISGDRFVSTHAEGEALRAQLPDALAVKMDGAAVAQVCHDFQRFVIFSVRSAAPAPRCA